MKRHKAGPLTCALIVIMLSLALMGFSPQSKTENNAALRYWMAFAATRDLPLDEDTGALIERAARGTSPIDERLVSMLSANSAALATMHRGATLPACEWGVEYQLGAATPLYHLARARALGRLNALHASWLASRAEDRAATDAWLAGLQFGRHIAQDRTLLGAISGNAVLIAHLHSIAAFREKLSPPQIERLKKAARGLPAYGVDWTAALLQEAASGEQALQDLRASAEPAARFKEWTGKEPPVGWVAPSAAEASRFGVVLREVAPAFSLPEAQARPRIKEAEQAISRLGPAARALVPDLTRALDARIEFERARQGLVDR